MSSPALIVAGEIGDVEVVKVNCVGSMEVGLGQSQAPVHPSAPGEIQAWGGISSVEGQPHNCVRLERVSEAMLTGVQVIRQWPSSGTMKLTWMAC